MKTLSKSIAFVAGLLALVGMGCDYESPYFQKAVKYQGYDLRVGVEPTGRYLLLFDGGNRCIRADDSNRDGRFDSIDLQVPKGHPFEKLVNLDKLEEIYKEALK